MRRLTQTRIKRTEVWGLELPDGRVLDQGYSERVLRSPTDVVKDFDKNLSGKPVMISRHTVEAFYG